jgi:hypothetical protein
MFQYPKKYPEAPTKNGRWIKKTVYNLPSKKFFFRPRADAPGGEGLWLRQSHRSGAN